MFARPDPVAAQKLRANADRLQKAIDHAHRPMTQNLTNKRNREFRARLWDGDNTKRIQSAMRALADAHERGDCPSALAKLRRCPEISPLVHKGFKSFGYYDFTPCHEYERTDEVARALQAMIDTPTDLATRARREVETLEASARLAKLPGFFATPPAFAQRMAELADIRPGDIVLEPSAGSGRLIDAAIAAQPACVVEACERAMPLRELLVVKRRFTKFDLVGDDFLSLPRRAAYDVVLMNPPFERGTDIEHVTVAFNEHLKPGGRLVAIVSSGALYRTDRQAQAFRRLLEDVADDAEGLPVPGGSFDDTNVSAVVVVLRKPALAPLDSIEPGPSPFATLSDDDLDALDPDYVPLFASVPASTPAKMHSL